MNSYERVMTAMKMGQPDRVPVVECVIDPKVIRAICPEARDFGDLSDFLDLDNVGCGPVFRQEAQTDDGYVDEWGVRYLHSREVVSHPVQGPIRSREDLKDYTPPDPDAPHRLGLLPELVRRYKGRRAIFFHHRAAFMWSAYLMGMEQLLIAFMDDPTFVAELMDVVMSTNERILRNAARAGADVIVLGDDYAANWGPIFSPKQFEQLVLPRLQRAVDAIHEEGALVIKHSDGNLWPLLDMIVDTGADGLNPLEPVAQMHMDQVKAKYGDRICLVGNIDCGELLSHGTVEQVEAAVEKCIIDGAAGGGFMLASSNSIHSSVDSDNYVAMVRAGRRLGDYANLPG